MMSDEDRPLAEYFDGLKREHSEESRFTAAQVAEIIRQDRDA